MPKILIEACCGSADDALEAARGGADRVELNSALHLGGLTPSAGSLRVLRESSGVPVMAMLRPREGGFCYSGTAFRTMLADGELLLRAGADGLVFGCLTPDGEIDEPRVRALVALCGGRPAVFHRAIDVTPDWRRALEALIRCGVTRVLTSGQAKSAMLGAQTIAQMVRFAQGAIEILPGAGVTPDNVLELLEITGCTQVHLSRRRELRDTSTRANPSLRFGHPQSPPEDEYTVTDAEAFARLRALLP